MRALPTQPHITAISASKLPAASPHWFRFGQLTDELKGDDYRALNTFCKNHPELAPIVVEGVKSLGTVFPYALRCYGFKRGISEGLLEWLRESPTVKECLLRWKSPLERCLDLKRVEANPELFSFTRGKPEAMTALVERYGTGALGLQHTFGAECLKRAEIHKPLYDRLFAMFSRAPYSVFAASSFSVPDETLVRNTDWLLSLGRLTKSAAADCFRAISAETFSRAPERLIELAQLFKEDTPFVFSLLGRYASDVSSKEVSSLYRLYRTLPDLFNRKGGGNLLSIDLDVDLNETREDFREKRARIILDAVPELLSLAEEIGTPASGLIIEFGLAASRLSASQKREIKQMIRILKEEDFDKQEVSEIFSNIVGSVFLKNPGYYLSLVKNAGPLSDDITHELSLSAWQHSEADHVRRLMKCAGYGATNIMRFWSDSAPLYRDFPEIMYPITEVLGEKITRLKSILTREFIEERGNDLVKEVKRHGQAIVGLLERFGNFYFETAALYSSEIERVKLLTGEGASRFFSRVPVEYWGDPDALSACAFFEEAAAFEYSSMDFEPFRLPTHEMERARELFGIRHFYRLSGPPLKAEEKRDSLRLIKRALLTYDKGPEIEGPLYVEILPRSDHNGAFADAWISSEAVSSHYNVFYLESGDIAEATNLLRRMACLRGVDSMGSPLKPIEHVTFSFHGNQNGMYPGFLPEGARKPRLNNNGHFVSSADEAVFEEWSRYIAPGGSVFLNSCSTARHYGSGQNFAESLKRYLPGVRVWASRRSLSDRKYVLGPHGEISGVRISRRSGDAVEV